MPQNSQELGAVNGKRFEDWAPWEGRGVPLRSNCDLANPRQTFLWMFVAMPGVKGAPLIMPTDYWERQSFRMCVLGGGITGESGLKYQPPHNMANPWTAPGRYVPLDEPDPPRLSVQQVMEGLGQADRAEVRDYVLKQTGLGDEIPAVPDGKYRVSDLAVRLGVDVAQLVSVLADFGMTVEPSSLVGRDVADRIVFHLGLDA